MTLSIGIMKLLEQQGLSQREMAAIVGVHPSEISRIKSGSREWTTSQLVSISEYLNMPFGELLSGGRANRERDGKQSKSNDSDPLTQYVHRQLATLVKVQRKMELLKPILDKAVEDVRKLYVILEGKGPITTRARANDH